MRGLSFTEKLLGDVEVEWKILEEVSDIYDSLHQTPQYSDNGLSMIRVTDIKGGFVNLDETLKVNNEVFETFTKKYLPQKLDLVMSRVGSYGNVGIIPSDNTACMGQNTVVINPRINNKYLFYILVSNIAQNFIERNVGGGNQKTLSLKSIKKIPILIPCPDNPNKSLEIQAEIVRILDTFTELTAELTAELNTRKKQYNYYRDQMLSFEEWEVEWKTLGELAENLDSKRKPITSGLREAGEIPYYGASGIVDYVKDYIFDGDFLLVSEDGANLLARNTPIAFSVTGKTWVNNHAHVLKFVTYAERRYIEFYLNSIDLTPYISGAAQPKLNQKNLNSIKIPNSSPEKKARIVAILDKFDALTSSITEGLPREITLRQQQYEYYRDLLLSFPKQDAEVAA